MEVTNEAFNTSAAPEVEGFVQKIQTWRTTLTPDPQWRNRPGGFTTNPHRFATGCHNAQFGTVAHQRIGKPGALVEEMLAVVEHNHDLARLELLQDRLHYSTHRYLDVAVLRRMLWATLQV